MQLPWNSNSHGGAQGGATQLRGWTWLGLLLVPLLIVGVLGVAFWAPMSHASAGTVAVVNNDKMVEINGQPAPLGREMAAKLVNSTDSGYSWEMTDSADAAEGLAAGTYSAVVVIPPEFSGNVASAMSGAPLDATRAGVRVQVSPAAAPADAAAVDAAARRSVEVFNRQILEMLLDGFYGGFAQMHGQMGTAVDASRKLADGSAQLADGSGKLAEGTGQLSPAAQQLADGGSQLADGADQLTSGTGQLSDGLTQLDAQTRQLPAQTQQLADGAKQVAAGNQQMADALVPMADQILAITDKLPHSDSTQGLTQLAEQCPTVGGVTSDFCTQLKEQSESLSRSANLVDQIRQPALQIKQGAQGLAFGSAQVAKGNQQLANGMRPLSQGISALAQGSQQLHGGTQQLSGGAHQLAGGLGQFNTGVRQLDGGAQQLAGGARQLADGNRQFADGMAPASDKIPHYSDAERNHLKTVAASPAGLNAENGSGFGKALIALLVVLALWTAALGVYVVMRAIPRDAVQSRRSTWRLVADGLGASSILGAVSALLVSLGLAAFLDLSVGAWFGFLGVTMLAAVSFMAVHHALVAFFGLAGRVVSIAVLALTIAGGVISTVPEFLQNLSGLMPTGGAVQALAAVVTGGSGAGSGIAQLVAWGIAGILASVLATERARMVSGRKFLSGRGSALPTG